MTSVVGSKRNPILVPISTKIEDNVGTLVDTTPIPLPDRPRILIVKMWAIGDILMATPLLRALHRHYPGCRITWFVDKRYASILDGNPMIDEVYAFDARLWQKRQRYGQIGPYLQMTHTMRRDLRARNFDAVINLTAEKWWSVWFGLAPVRIGLFPRPDIGYMGRLYTKPIKRSLDIWLHNSEHYILPAPALGIPGPYDRRMSVPDRPEDTAFVDDWLRAQPPYRPDLPIIVLHPGTSQASKCWPVDHFAELAHKLIDTHNIVITGSPDELDLAQSIIDSYRRMGVPARPSSSAAVPPPSSVTAPLAPSPFQGEGWGEVSGSSSPLPSEERANPGEGSVPIIAAGAFPDLRQTVALVRKAAAVVTGDTSVLHIASAVETPVVGVYGSTRPGDNAPFFGDHVYVYNESVECSPCGHADCPLKGADQMKCMRTVTVDQVYSALRTYVQPAGIV